LSGRVTGRNRLDRLLSIFEHAWKFFLRQRLHGFDRLDAGDGAPARLVLQPNVIAASCHLPLNPEQQKSYEYAMQPSAEKGPCCCQCWRWHLYGGLAKLLICGRAFTGQLIGEVRKFFERLRRQRLAQRS
jgi:hypothetical protein